MDIISNFLNFNFSSKNKIPIIVAGDNMIDEYFYLKCDRISPEAPVPVLFSETDAPSLVLPGGVANLASQFQNFGFDVQPFLFQDDKKEMFNYVNKIPRKKRFYVGDQFICRWDIELENYGCKVNELNEIHNSSYNEYLNSPAGVAILSDYNKGYFNDYSISLFLNSNKITIVDPKKGPASKWRGCNIIKPNLSEAEAMSGTKDCKAQCDYFMKETGCDACVITRGSNSVFSKIGNKYFEYKPDMHVVANNTVGAGDCFAAFLGMGIAANFSTKQSIELASIASSISVQNNLTSPISPFDFNFLLNDVSKYKVIKDLKQLKNRNYKLAFANGCFDIIHEGHIELLKFAKSQADKLVVALNTDDSVRKIKGSTRPINTLNDRMKILSEFSFVDYVVSFGEETPLKVIEEILPNVIVKGGDYAPQNVVGKEYAEIKIFPYISGKSTTAIIEHIKNQ